MRHYHVRHRTQYQYQFPVSTSHHSAHLQPIPHARQQLHRFDLSIDPQPAELSARIDYFGNPMHLFSIQEPHQELVVESVCEIGVESTELPDPAETPTCEETRRHVADSHEPELIHAIEFTRSSPRVSTSSDEIRALAARILLPDRPVLEAALALTAEFHREFTFDRDATDVSTPVEEFLHLKRGVCQDFAHLMLACLRARQLPSRYVSGYILTHPPEGQPRQLGADASHAWVAVLIPGIGWVDIDPTNNLLCSDEHVTIAVGRDYSDVSLVRGAVIGGGLQEIEIEVSMFPMDHSPAPHPMINLPIPHVSQIITEPVTPSGF